MDSRRGLPTLVEDCRNDDDDDAELLLLPVPPRSASDLKQMGTEIQSSSCRGRQPEGPPVAGGAPRSAESTRDSSRQRHSGGLRSYRHSAREAGIVLLKEVTRRLQQLGLTQAPTRRRTPPQQRMSAGRARRGAPDGGVWTDATSRSSTAVSASACCSPATRPAPPAQVPSSTVPRTRSATAVLVAFPSNSPELGTASKPCSPTQQDAGGGSLPVMTRAPKARSPWRSPSISPKSLSGSPRLSQSGRSKGDRCHHRDGGSNAPSSVETLLAVRVESQLRDRAKIPPSSPQQWQGSQPRTPGAPDEPDLSGSPHPTRAPSASGISAVTTLTAGANLSEAQTVTPGSSAERATPTTPVNRTSAGAHFNLPHLQIPSPRLADTHSTGRRSCDVSSSLSGSGREILSPSLVDRLRGVTNQLQSASDWRSLWHEEIRVRNGLGSAPGTAVSSPAGASKWWQRQAVGFCEQPEGPVTNPLRGKHRRRRGGQWHSFGGESFGELLPSGWADGEYDTPRTGPVTGRPYSERMGDSYVMGG